MPVSCWIFLLIHPGEYLDIYDCKDIYQTYFYEIHKGQVSRWIDHSNRSWTARSVSLKKLLHDFRNKKKISRAKKIFKLNSVSLVP